jgi:phage tail-like protein
MGFPIPPLPLNQALDPPMTHRFGVFFLVAGKFPNPLDIRFQEVSGLEAKITTRADVSASATLSHRLTPIGVEYGDLELQRGMVLGSSLMHQVINTFNNFKFTRSDVLLTIFSEIGIPTIAYLFNEAYPINWKVGKLNANTEDILIESLTLTYARVRTFSL